MLLWESMSIKLLAIEKCEKYRSNHCNAPNKWDSSGTEGLFKNGTDRKLHCNPDGEYVYRNKLKFSILSKRLGVAF
jgi:hypothetical protein